MSLVEDFTPHAIRKTVWFVPSEVAFADEELSFRKSLRGALMIFRRPRPTLDAVGP
jgi:hypothetical protein